MCQNLTYQYYNLQNVTHFKIDKDCIPMDSNGTTKNSSASLSISLLHNYRPTCLDVVCGRGKESRVHEGNKNFIRVIQNNLQSYLKARTRDEKSNLIRCIVDSVKCEARSVGGVGFLKKQSCGWVELGDQRAREKVGHAIRDMLKQQRRLSCNTNNPKSCSYIPIILETTQEKKREALLQKQKDLFLQYIREDLCSDHVPMTRYVTEFYNNKK